MVMLYFGELNKMHYGLCENGEQNVYPGDFLTSKGQQKILQ